ncbi:hypothetical protein SAMN06265373_10664 [Shimia sagamensis]|uniref:Uncharacterized protein n=2 Tax=Shimia sagamensis TaxID=1566352 RepID=A0ABY1P8S7_9RHOB|nr:hypothetical protein SAMN06265373_10664 [Shimia sagamensis]
MKTAGQTTQKVPLYFKQLRPTKSEPTQNRIEPPVHLSNLKLIDLGSKTIVLPASYDVKLRKLEKTIQQAKRDFEKEQDIDSLASDITDALISLHLLLDRAQNQIWAKYNSKKEGRGKPNIYFPVTSNKERFTERLQKDQLHELQNKNPRIFELIENTQPFEQDSNWLEKLHEISSNRHERDATIQNRQAVTGFGLGRGQDLYIRHMSITNGNVFFDGLATNQQTGQTEPLKFTPTVENRLLLEDLSTDPIEFAKLAHSRSKTLLTQIFNAL